MENFLFVKNLHLYLTFYNATYATWEFHNILTTGYKYQDI